MHALTGRWGFLVRLRQCLLLLAPPFSWGQHPLKWIFREVDALDVIHNGVSIRDYKFFEVSEGGLVPGHFLNYGLFEHPACACVIGAVFGTDVFFKKLFRKGPLVELGVDRGFEVIRLAFIVGLKRLEGVYFLIPSLLFGLKFFDELVRLDEKKIYFLLGW